MNDAITLDSQKTLEFASVTYHEETYNFYYTMENWRVYVELIVVLAISIPRLSFLGEYFSEQII